MKTGREKVLQWKLEWLSDSTSQQLGPSYDALKADWPTSSLEKKKTFWELVLLRKKCFILFQNESDPILANSVCYSIRWWPYFRWTPALPFHIQSVQELPEKAVMSASHRSFSPSDCSFHPTLRTLLYFKVLHG